MPVDSVIPLISENSINRKDLYLNFGTGCSFQNREKSGAAKQATIGN